MSLLLAPYRTRRFQPSVSGTRALYRVGVSCSPTFFSTLDQRFLTGSQISWILRCTSRSSQNVGRWRVLMPWVFQKRMSTLWSALVNIIQETRLPRARETQQEISLWARTGAWYSSPRPLRARFVTSGRGICENPATSTAHFIHRAGSSRASKLGSGALSTALYQFLRAGNRAGR